MSAIYFVDTSALAKRYLLEIGATWTRSWIERSAGNLIVISALTSVEMFSLLNRRYRSGDLEMADASKLKANFLFHFRREFKVVTLDSDVLKRSRDLTETHPLRALDAVQLSCALEVLLYLETPMTFVSADNNLLAAARAEGFMTDNPLDHV